jgi:hypothetical protein
VRPLRPGLSVAHPSVWAGTPGGLVRTASGLAILSNDHVLAASDAAAVGDPVLKSGPAGSGVAGGRMATSTAFQRFRGDTPSLVDAAVAARDPGVDPEPGGLPGGALLAAVPASLDIDADEAVETVGRTTGLPRGLVTAVEVDGVAVQYDALSSPRESTGSTTRSRSRAPPPASAREATAGR